MSLFETDNGSIYIVKEKRYSITFFKGTFLQFTLAYTKDLERKLLRGKE